MNPDWRSPRALALLAGFVVLVVGVGGAIGTVTAPGAWYASLEKPPFNPPSWVFGPVWTVLYVLIAVAGWRTFRRAPQGGAMAIWVGQMALNWMWSPVFFALQALWLAVVVILPMLGLIVAFIVTSWREDRTAAWLFVPYAAWVGFASVLNISLAVLNP